MLKSKPNEKWKKFETYRGSKAHYMISNLGRLASYTDNVKDAKIIAGSTIKRYRTLNYKITKNNKTQYFKLFVHRLVAENFNSNSNSKKKTYVLHLDHNPNNNSAKNLKWATYEEMVEHKKSNPRIIASQKRLTEFNKGKPGHKLTVAKVKQIKKQLSTKNRKHSFAQIAANFDISEMQLYRIKAGINWGYVKP